MRIRLWTYSKGEEVSHIWRFEPLRAVPGIQHVRDEDASSNGELRRRPYMERDVLTVTWPAGLLRFGDHKANAKRLFRAHKIEIEREIDGKLAWVEYHPDLEGDVEFETLEDIDRLVRFSIKFVQAEPLSFQDFEDATKQVTSW